MKFSNIFRGNMLQDPPPPPPKNLHNGRSLGQNKNVSQSVNIFAWIRASELVCKKLGLQTMETELELCHCPWSAYIYGSFIYGHSLTEHRNIVDKPHWYSVCLEVILNTDIPQKESPNSLVITLTRLHAQTLPSYIKNATHLLNKLNQIDVLPPNAILVTLDVSPLYTNIPTNEGIDACRKL